MLPHPPDCRNCALDLIGEGFTEPEGGGESGVLVVGEASGEHESWDSLPFRPQAPAGSILERTFRDAEVPRIKVGVTNIIRCRPPKNLLEHQPYELPAIAHCQVHFKHVVESYKPKVMLALGGVALRTLAGYAGKKQSITNVRGFYLDGYLYPDIPVIGSYHPADIGRDKPNLLGVLRLDLLRAVALAKAGGKFERPKKDYLIFPDRGKAMEWLERAREHPELPICYDIETVESLKATEEGELGGTPSGSVTITKVREEEADLPEPEIGDAVEIEEQERVETVPFTRITQIQFSILGTGDALVLRWDEWEAEFARQVMELPNEKWGWNCWGFDFPVLLAHGVQVKGRHVDFMWAWHSYQPDLPRGLQYATSFWTPSARPWKHLADTEPGEYGGDDVAYLRAYGPRLLQALKDKGIWNSFDRHVCRMNPIMVRAAARGIARDQEAVAVFKGEVETSREELDGQLQAVFPDELRPCQPKQGYANPTIAEKVQASGKLEKGQRWIRRIFHVTPKKPRKKKDDAQGVLEEVSTGAEGGAEEACTVDSGRGDLAAEAPTTVEEERWVRLLPFLPNSRLHILAYTKWKRAQEIEEREARGQARDVAERNAKYVVPRDFKEGKETTAKKELERLGKKTGDTFYPSVITHREYGKMLSTYVEGWKPGPDGKVHTQFGYAPATGQTSSRGPNVQNAPKIGDLGDRFRKTIVASPGHRLVEADYKSFHALTLAFNARDVDYLRLARLDVHSFLAGHILKLPGREGWLKLPDVDLAQVLKEIKNESKPEYRNVITIKGVEWGTNYVREKIAKPGVHGIGFGLGYKKLYNLNQESFGVEGDAKVVIDTVRRLFPKLFVYQNAQRELAYRQKFLMNHFWRIRWFFDVMHRDFQQQRLVPGKDSEAAIAFGPASDAFGMKDEVMLWLGENPTPEDNWMDRFWYINDLHDAPLFDCPDGRVEECLHLVKQKMEEPSPRMVNEVAPGGLWCGVDVKVSGVGGNWAPARDRAGVMVNPGGMEEVKV
jgi:uracil-DNA glycosylase